MRKYILALVPMTLLCAVEVQAIPITFTTFMTGAAENPSNPSLGTGVATVIYDATTHELIVNATFADLTGTTTASHIHCCTNPPGNVGVATELPFFAGFPIGVTSGIYDHTFDLTLAGSWNPAFVTANGGIAGAEAALAAGLASGRSYFNIHTTFRPGGEIRGFLVPEPATLGLIGIGIGTLAFARRKRRA